MVGLECFCFLWNLLIIRRFWVLTSCEFHSVRLLAVSNSEIGIGYGDLMILIPNKQRGTFH